MGYSHDINFKIPKEIEIIVNKNTITIKGTDKQIVGQVAAEIRSFRPQSLIKVKVLNIVMKLSSEKLVSSR